MGDDHEYWIMLLEGRSRLTSTVIVRQHLPCGGAEPSPLVERRWRVNGEGTVNAPRHRPRALGASAPLVSGDVNWGKFESSL